MRKRIAFGVLQTERNIHGVVHVEYKTEGGGSITFSDEVLENVEKNQ